MVQRMPIEEVPRIAIDEAKRKHGQGEAVIVDVRDSTDYNQGHVAGAIHMPATEIPRRHQELPADKEIVTY